MNRIMWNLILALPLLMLLPGCTNAIKPVQSPADVPLQFKRNGKTELPDQWWKAFNDKGLNSCIDIALSDNFSLKTVWDRLSQAEALARREGAAMWPEADLNGGVGTSRQRREGRSESFNSFMVGLSVRYEVDLWGRIKYAHDAALLDVKASHHDVQTAAISLTATVAKVWYQLAEQLAQENKLAEQLKVNQTVLEIITTQFKQGQIRAADVLRQRQLVQSTQGRQILVQSRIEVLRHQLAVLLGKSPATALKLPLPKLIELPDLPQTGLPIQLLQRRPDLQKAQLDVQATDRRLSSAIADQYPRISISTSIQTSGAETRDLFDNWLANLAANLTQPLFDGGRRSAEVDRHKAIVSQAINQYGQAVLTAFQEVEDAMANEAHQIDYLNNLKTQLDTSQQVIDSIRDNYINGQLDYLRVLEALTTRQNLERDYLTARRDLIDSRIDLCRAIAGGWVMSTPPLAKLKNNSSDNKQAKTKNGKGSGYE